MEDLREKVYECTLAVEAHMIVDLLARAGISARTDGEFLAGAGGDLPLGNTIKVRVDPSRAVEARAVIDEWEKIQPTPEPAAPPRRAASRSPLWFLVGGACGYGIAFAMLNSPRTTDGIDYDGDGIREVIYHYAGGVPQSTEVDRNRDGRIDEIWNFDLRGMEESLQQDNDFDGRFEWRDDFDAGEMKQGTLDANADGNPEQVVHYRFGIVDTIDLYDESGLRIAARQHYAHERLDFTEIDADGDGAFEKRVDYDRLGLPK
ncbi:MAG: DUF2007 domain-containing protein [Burkholderiaceae bacterium]